MFYALLLDAHHEEAVPGEEEGRTVLKLHKDIAPFKYAILPLSKKENLTKMATDIFHQLIPLTSADFDVAGSIGMNLVVTPPRLMFSRKEVQKT